MTCFSLDRFLFRCALQIGPCIEMSPLVDPPGNIHTESSVVFTRAICSAEWVPDKEIADPSAVHREILTCLVEHLNSLVRHALTNGIWPSESRKARRLFRSRRLLVGALVEIGALVEAAQFVTDILTSLLILEMRVDGLADL